MKSTNNLDIATSTEEYVHQFISNTSSTVPKKTQEVAKSKSKIELKTEEVFL